MRLSKQIFGIRLSGKSITSTSLLKTTKINKYDSHSQGSMCAWYYAKHVTCLPSFISYNSTQ